MAQARKPITAEARAAFRAHPKTIHLRDLRRYLAQTPAGMEAKAERKRQAIAAVLGERNAEVKAANPELTDDDLNELDAEE